MKAEHSVRVSHEWIYHHSLQDKLSGGDLYRHLRCQKQRRKRYGSHNRRGQIVDRISIDERQAIASLTERKSRYTLIHNVKRKTATGISKTIIRLLLPLSDHVKTLTSDNGKEFSKHKTIAQALNADFYFTYPYTSWERGLNENINGLIRQYFPKHRGFTTSIQKEINQVVSKLNNRSIKCLGIKTPNQVLLGIGSTVEIYYLTR